MRPPNDWARARVTLAIALVTAACWLAADLLGWDEWAAIWGGFIPARYAFRDQGLAFAPFWLTPLTATLVHAGLLHLAFNLLILMFCGRQVEPIVGPVNLGILYVVGAYAAAGAQYLAGPTGALPMVGASGAISALLGAYALLLGRNKVKLRPAWLATTLNALWLLAAWVILNLVMGFVIASGEMPLTGQGMQVAIAAHIGGFLAGLLLARPLFELHWRKA
jgi:membrane associated rhomboid family serine protease